MFLSIAVISSCFVVLLWLRAFSSASVIAPVPQPTSSNLKFVKEDVFNSSKTMLTKPCKIINDYSNKYCNKINKLNLFIDFC